VVGQLSHRLDFLLDILDQVWFFGELLLVDTLDGVDFVIWRFEFDFFD